MKKPNKKNFFGSNGRFQKQRFNYVKAVYRNYLKEKKQIMDEKYTAWLHALTLLGYNEHIVIRTQDQSVIEACYNTGDSPEDALKKYKLHLQHNPENK